MQPEANDFFDGLTRSIDYLRSDADLIGGLWTILALMIASYFITRHILRRSVLRLFEEVGKSAWAEVIKSKNLFTLLSYWAPLSVLDFGLDFFDVEQQLSVPDDWDLYDILINGLLAVEFVLAIAVLDRLLTIAAEVYGQSEAAHEHPVKGYVQLARIVLFSFGAIVAVALLIGESPWQAITGLGALSAVLVLVFRDTILSFIAGLHLTTNRLMRNGDWIEMPELCVDGEVVDIGLHIVKIQNFDKTIVTVPTQKLMEGGFKNWRGMQEFGGRRFKRAIYIDPNSVRFCTIEHLEKLSFVDLIADEVAEELERVGRFRASLREDTAVLDENSREQVYSVRVLNGPYRTNLDFFLLYLEKFVHADERVHPDGTRLIRQLPLLSSGALPVEVYVFLSDTQLVSYEAAASSLYAYFVSAAPVFDLRFYLGR